MKTVLNFLLLGLLIVCLGTGVTLFGGVLPEHALLFYGVTTTLLVVWGAKWILCRRVSGMWSPLHVPVILFLVYALLRYFGSPVEHASRIDLFQIGLAALIYFLVSQNLHRPRDRAAVLCALAVIAVAQSAYALWQYKTGIDEVLWLDRGHDYQGRGSGTYFCPNHLAGLLEMVLGLLVGWLVAYRDPDAPLQGIVLRRLGAVTAVAFILLGLFTTASRGSWLAIVATIPIMLLLAEATRTISSRTAILAFVVFVSVGGGLWGVPAIRSRIGDAFDFDLHYRLGEKPVEVKGGFSGRTAMWRSTLRLIADYPAFGTGPGTWQWTHLQYRLPDTQIRAQYAHNDVLQLVAEYGVTGLVIILGVFALFYWQAIQLARAAPTSEQRAFAIGAMAAVTAILIHSFGDFNFHIPANALVVATLLGLIAAQARAGESSERTRVPLLIKTVVGIVVIAIALSGAWTGSAIALANRAAARGFDAAQQHEWDEALTAYRAALRYDPRAPEIHALIGDVYRIQSSLISDEELQPERQLIGRRGMAAYQRALELNRFYSEVMLKMAAACELAGDTPLAFRWYEQALQVDPNNAFNWIRLGTYYHRQGDTPKAVAALEHARKLNPGDWTAVNVLKEIQTGQP